MDDIDMELIKLLSENSRISITDLSKQISLSRPSVKERIEKMIDLGIIDKFTISVNHHKMGNEIVFYANISNVNIPYNNFENIMREMKEIIEIHRVTGHNNYIIKVVTKDISRMNRLLEALVHYCKVESYIVIDSIL